MCRKLASIVVVRVVTTDSRNRLVLHEQPYIADCKDEGNILKPYIYRSESNNSNKINNFISGVRILWNTLINDCSPERGGVRTISGVVRKLVL